MKSDPLQVITPLPIAVSSVDLNLQNSESVDILSNSNSLNLVADSLSSITSIIDNKEEKDSFSPKLILNNEVENCLRCKDCLFNNNYETELKGQVGCSTNEDRTSLGDEKQDILINDNVEEVLNEKHIKSKTDMDNSNKDMTINPFSLNFDANTCNIKPIKKAHLLELKPSNLQNFSTKIKSFPDAKSFSNSDSKTDMFNMKDIGMLSCIENGPFTDRNLTLRKHKKSNKQNEKQGNKPIKNANELVNCPDSVKYNWNLRKSEPNCEIPNRYNLHNSPSSDIVLPSIKKSLSRENLKSSCSSSSNSASNKTTPSTPSSEKCCCINPGVSHACASRNIDPSTLGVLNPLFDKHFDDFFPYFQKSSGSTLKNECNSLPLLPDLLQTSMKQEEESIKDKEESMDDYLNKILSGNSSDCSKVENIESPPTPFSLDSDKSLSNSKLSETAISRNNQIKLTSPDWFSLFSPSYGNTQQLFTPEDLKEELLYPTPYGVSSEVYQNFNAKEADFVLGWPNRKPRTDPIDFKENIHTKSFITNDENKSSDAFECNNATNKESDSFEETRSSSEVCQTSTSQQNSNSMMPYLPHLLAVTLPCPSPTQSITTTTFNESSNGCICSLDPLMKNTDEAETAQINESQNSNNSPKSSNSKKPDAVLPNDFIKLYNYDREEYINFKKRLSLTDTLIKTTLKQDVLTSKPNMPISSCQPFQNNHRRSASFSFSSNSCPDHIDKGDDESSTRRKQSLPVICGKSDFDHLLNIQRKSKSKANMMKTSSRKKLSAEEVAEEDHHFEEQGEVSDENINGIKHKSNFGNISKVSLPSYTRNSKERTIPKGLNSRRHSTNSQDLSINSVRKKHYSPDFTEKTISNHKNQNRGKSMSPFFVKNHTNQSTPSLSSSSPSRDSLSKDFQLKACLEENLEDLSPTVELLGQMPVSSNTSTRHHFHKDETKNKSQSKVKTKRLANVKQTKSKPLRNNCPYDPNTEVNPSTKALTKRNLKKHTKKYPLSTDLSEILTGDQTPYTEAFVNQRLKKEMPDTSGSISVSPGDIFHQPLVPYELLKNTTTPTDKQLTSAHQLKTRLVDLIF